ncbi:suppressor of cytokine signaling 3 [Pteropus vampyrus]|uniref:Suppressor of cytokine signaling 3 n=1 Tax=Pteropus vampyrus TaxID=132908 RepID=A0A6P3QMU3_PTEVA|nr:suppressor of cytokine signaling 3 [Pteropus vampyrus]
MLVNVERATLEVQIQPLPNLKEKVRISQGAEDSSTQREANAQSPRSGKHLGDSLELCMAAAQGVRGPGAADEAQMELRAFDTQSLRGLAWRGDGKLLEMLETPRETGLAELFEDKQLFEICLTQEGLRGSNTKLHSTYESPGRPLADAGRRSEYQLVVNAVRKLQESGFYWSAVTGGEANLLLSAEPAGTFLIRDSSDQRHFFTLSVKTQSGTKNLRIQCEGGSFSLQSDPRSTQPVPRFDCVLKLVHHYMPPPSAPSFPSPPSEPSSPSAEVPEQTPAQPLPGTPPRRAYYIYSGGEKIPLVLSRPLSSNVATLQHLCRKTVNGHLDSYEKVTQLPGPIREFLDQYDAPL